MSFQYIPFVYVCVKVHIMYIIIIIPPRILLRLFCPISFLTNNLSGFSRPLLLPAIPSFSLPSPPSPCHPLLLPPSIETLSQWLPPALPLPPFARNNNNNNNNNRMENTIENNSQTTNNNGNGRGSSSSGGSSRNGSIRRTTTGSSGGGGGGTYRSVKLR